MADEPQGPDEKTPPAEQKSLEMRVAELEDKLNQMHVTEDELKAYAKVSSVLARGGLAAGAGGGVAAACTDCVVGCLNECLIRQPIVRQPIVRHWPPIIRQCYECFECGGGLPGGGGIIGGSGFGTLGG